MSTAGIMTNKFGRRILKRGRCYTIPTQKCLHWHLPGQTVEDQVQVDLSGDCGPESAVYGDHAELSAMTKVGNERKEHGNDFASTIGAGGVVGTKFVRPDRGPKFKDVNLAAAKEERWKKWIALYNQIREVMPMQDSLSIERMCHLARVSRAGFYRSLHDRMPVEESMEVRSAIQQGTADLCR